MAEVDAGLGLRVDPLALDVEAGEIGALGLRVVLVGIPDERPVVEPELGEDSQLGRRVGRKGGVDAAAHAPYLVEPGRQLQGRAILDPDIAVAARGKVAGGTGRDGHVLAARGDRGQVRQLVRRDDRRVIRPSALQRGVTSRCARVTQHRAVEGRRDLVCVELVDRSRIAGRAGVDPCSVTDDLGAVLRHLDRTAEAQLRRVGVRIHVVDADVSSRDHAGVARVAALENEAVVGEQHVAVDVAGRTLVCRLRRWPLVFTLANDHHDRDQANPQQQAAEHGNQESL